jgi:phytanoyl-CoA hydroxylase
MFRRLKLAYSIYNFFQKDKLKHNIEVYKKLGMNKYYFSPISSKDFNGIDASVLNKDFVDKNLEETQIFKNADENNKKQILDYDKNGYIVLSQYLSDKYVDEINAEVQYLLDTKKVNFRYTNKIMFAIHQSPLLREVGNNSALKELLSCLVKDNVKLFQSINFLMGSEQKTHSDSIHMTTFPLGGLLGVWIALEDIDEENGALHYYPGSHKLPYYLNADYDNEGNDFLIGKYDYTAYENMLEKKIKENNLEKKIFRAKKGDLLIWHANLFHGGEPHPNKNKTRKSMVFHYYRENSVCYHEITQRPALIFNN